MGREIVDFRSDDERANEKRAQTPLEAADETIAQELAQLSRELTKIADVPSWEGGRPIERATPGSKSPDPQCKRIREIGEFLCSHGGSNRMDLICYRVAVLARTSRWCRVNWQRVCGWYY
jgi:hypothetical protein